MEKKTGNKLYLVFNLFFSLFFFLTFILIIFNNRNSVLEYRRLWLLLSGLAGPAAVYFLFRLFQKTKGIKPSSDSMALGACLVLYLVLQVYLGWSLRVGMGSVWDMGVVYEAAVNYVNNGVYPDSYFQLFPNNSGLYVFWCIFFSILRNFGIRDFLFPSIVLNSLAINASLLLLFLCVRHTLGRKKAWFALFFAFCTVPLAVYSPIIYTDTLTQIFPIGSAYMWIITRERIQKGNRAKALTGFLILSAYVALGSLLKISVAIIWVAIVIDLLFFVKGTKRFIPLLGGAGIFAFMLFFGTRFLRSAWCLPVYDYSQSIPFTHWVMMGLHGDGKYYDPDYQLTLAASGNEARRALNIAEIKRRLSEMGAGGFVTHIMNKLSFIWGDPTYFIIHKLSREPQSHGFLNMIFNFDQPYYQLFAYSQFPLHLALVSGMFASAFKAARNNINRLTFVRIAIFGLTLFLLVWEARSRYLFNFIPLFILCGADALPENLSTFSFSREHKVKKNSGGAAREGGK